MEELSLLQRTLLRDTLQLQDSIPRRFVTSTAGASLRPDNASHQSECAHRIRFVSSASPVLTVTHLSVGATVHLKRSTIAEIALRQPGAKALVPREIISLRDARPIGIAIGIDAATIGGMATVVVSSMVNGLSSISGSIRGTHMVMPTTTTPRMIIIRTNMIHVVTKA